MDQFLCSTDQVHMSRFGMENGNVYSAYDGCIKLQWWTLIEGVHHHRFQIGAKYPPYDEATPLMLQYLTSIAASYDYAGHTPYDYPGHTHLC